MNALLRTETLRFLRAFRQRRSGLLWARGICVAITIAVALLIMLALLDWSLLIPDGVRWALSTAAYGIAAITAWVASLRHLMAGRTDRHAAILVQSSKVDLGETLLSAVELGQSESLEDAHYDSMEFRSRLQDDVAKKLGSVELSGLLPFKNVLRVVLALLVTMVVLAGLWFVPKLNFAAHFQRAALPFINLARPTDLRLTILHPSPADTSVARGDELPIVVESSGERTDRVELEIVDSEHGTTRTEMRREQLNRFASTLTVENDLKYRIRSRNTLSKFHSVHALPRPEVSGFEKSYRYPDYTGLEPLKEFDKEGHVSAVQGSVVSLKMETNVPVGLAELRLESTHQSDDMIIPLSISDDGQTLSGDLPISAEFATYRLRLESLNDKIDNRFDPTYEIWSTPDWAPVVRLVNPADDREALQGESISVEGAIRDDYGIVRVLRLWNVDSGPWQSEQLPVASNVKELNISEPWKLDAESFAVGSIVTLKLSASDGAGNVAESESVRLFIRRRTLADKEKAWSKIQAKLANQLSGVERLVNRARDAVNKAESTIRKPVSERDSADRMRIIQAADTLRQADEEQSLFRELLKQAIQETPARSDEEELMAIGRMLSEAKRRHSEPALEYMEQIARGEETARRDNHFQAKHRANEMAGKIGYAARLLRQLAAAEQGDEITGKARRLADRQNQITEAAKQAHDRSSKKNAGDELDRDTLARRDQQEFNEQASQNLQDSLGELAELADAERGRVEGLKRHLEHREQDLARQREHQARHDKSPETKKQWENARRLQDAYRHAEREAVKLAKRLDEQAHRAREELLRNALNATPGLHHVGHEANRLRDTLRNAEKRSLNDDEKKREEVARRQLSQQAEASAMQLRDNADLEESRKHATHRSASDQSLLARALEAMAEAEPGDYEQAKQLADHIQSIEQARKSLEADEQARELAKSLGELSRVEQKRNLPDDWQTARKRMEKLPATLREAGVDKKEVNQAKESSESQSARQINKEMERRAKESQSGDSPSAKPLGRPLGDLADRAQRQRNVAAAQADQAREQLRRLIPTISDQMQEMADDLNEQSSENRQLADQSESGDTDADQVAQSAEAMADRNAESQKKLNNLQDDLRREANAQKLADAESRERARDADDALAELRATKAAERAGEAQAALKRAAETDSSKKSPAEQSKALASASSQQAELAKQLRELGKKLADNQTGRDQLRAGEVDNPIDESLDRDYERAEQLADQLQGSGKNPENVLAMLEAELKKNPSMQDALRDIQDSATENAVNQLRNAQQQESKLDSQIQKLAEQEKEAPRSADNRQSRINEDVTDASEKLARAGRHAQRLGQEATAHSLDETSKQAADAAGRELDQARESLAKNDSAAKSTDKVSAANNRLSEIAKAAEATRMQATQSASQQGQANSDTSEAAQAEGRALAEALDKLDQAMHSKAEPNASNTASKSNAKPNSQQAQSNSAQQSQSQAKESFAEALRSLANAMANARQSQSQQQKQSGQSQSPGKSQTAQSAAAQKPNGGKPQFGKHKEDQSNAEDAQAQQFVGSDPRRWGDLPQQMAEEVFQSRDDTVAPEYRESIESYYKALSEKSRERQ